MTVEEFEFISRDGNKLYGKYWLPDSNEPDAIICLLHGLSEHIGRYDTFAEYFTKNNIAVFANDHPGHGRSTGKRGHARKFETLLDNVENLLKTARREFNDTLIFLYGQSWGGNIVANYVLKKNTSEVAGAVLSAPWLKLAFDPPSFKVTLAKMMKMIYPGYTDNSDIKSEKLTKDAQMAQAYDSDPLVHDRISASLYFDAIKTGVLAIDNAFKLTIPLLAIHGKGDQLTSWKATEEYVKNAGNKAAINLYEEVRHEPHNDLEREQVLADVLNWIRTQSQI